VSLLIPIELDLDAIGDVGGDAAGEILVGKAEEQHGAREVSDDLVVDDLNFHPLGHGFDVFDRLGFSRSGTERQHQDQRDQIREGFHG
jgi:hypothetical protein